MINLPYILAVLLPKMLDVSYIKKNRVIQLEQGLWKIHHIVRKSVVRKGLFPWRWDFSSDRVII